MASRPRSRAFRTRLGADHGLRQLCRGLRRGFCLPGAGAVTIHKITAATDCGPCRQPAADRGADRRQSFAYGLSTACSTARCTVKDGRPWSEENFDTYPRSCGWTEMPKPSRAVVMPVRRLLGRRRRADDRGRGTRGPERDLRGHGQAGAPDPDQERRPPQGVIRTAAILGLAVLGAGAEAAEIIPAAPPGALSCSGCHAVRPGPDEVLPRITGRPPEEIVAAMAAFRSGERPATVMDRIAKGFTDEESRAIAIWLGRVR